tara:strand:+ start:1604 stop:3118 length:1515 start_codon:yes stop_codon:yes gene_type:complete
MATPLYTGVVFKKEDILGKHIKMEQLKMNKEKHYLDMESSKQARKDKRAGKIDPNVDTSGYTMSREFRPMFRREVEKATQEIGDLYSAYKSGDNEALQSIEDVKRKIQYMGEDLTSLSTDITVTDSEFSNNKELYTLADDGSINYETNRDNIYSAFSGSDVTMANYQDYLNKYDVSIAGNTTTPETPDIFAEMRPKDGFMEEVNEEGSIYKRINESELSIFKSNFITGLSPESRVDENGNNTSVILSDDFRNDYFNGNVLMPSGDGNFIKDNAMNSFISKRFGISTTSKNHREKLDPSNPNYNKELASDYVNWRADMMEEEIRRQNKESLVETAAPATPGSGSDKALSDSEALDIMNDTEYTPYAQGIKLKSTWSVKSSGKVNLNASFYNGLDTKGKAYIEKALSEELSSGIGKDGDITQLLESDALEDVTFSHAGFTEENVPMAILIMPNKSQIVIPLKYLKSNLSTDKNSLKRLSFDPKNYNFEEVKPKSGSTSKYNKSVPE